MLKVLLLAGGADGLEALRPRAARWRPRGRGHHVRGLDRGVPSEGGFLLFILRSSCQSKTEATWESRSRGSVPAGVRDRDPSDKNESRSRLERGPMNATLAGSSALMMFAVAIATSDCDSRSELIQTREPQYAPWEPPLPFSGVPVDREDVVRHPALGAAPATAHQLELHALGEGAVLLDRRAFVSVLLPLKQRLAGVRARVGVHGARGHEVRVHGAGRTGVERLFFLTK